MHNNLKHLSSILQLASSSDDQSIYTVELCVSEDDLNILRMVQEKGGLEQVSLGGRVLDLDELTTGSNVVIEIVQHALQHLGYYHDFEAFIKDNLYQHRPDFYIRELDFEYPSESIDAKVQGYFAISHLISALSPLTLFTSDDSVRTIYLIQDTFAVALPLIYDQSLFEGKQPDLKKIDQFAAELSAHSDRKKIYTKELIDFLNLQHEPELRLIYLFRGFDSFYQNCEAAYAFFLSDFSYSKLKLELESAILDYSKNIRTIINDAQTKLIAIPAAFLVSSYSLDLEKPSSIKNFLIILSSLVFSTLIEIFIRNQESAVKIFKDNVSTYKTTFKLKNHTTDTKEFKTLHAIINDSFQAIDKELQNQDTRLNLIRYVNWGMSVSLVIVVLGLFIVGMVNAWSLLITLFVILSLIK